jgi:hypothetical protein
MIRLDAATVMLQWSVGGLGFLWFTTRRGVAGLGYAMLLRIVYGLFALIAVGLGWRYGVVWMREVSAVAVAIAAFAMLRNSTSRLDLLVPIVGVPGILAGALAAADGVSSSVVAVLRIIVSTAFLGAVSDAMLLGHWYLVQPGMERRLLNELTTAVIWTWPLEVVALVLPTGMVSVLNGTIDDGWDGVLGWFWVASAIVTGVLAFTTRAALREKSYSAVMAATGLMYLAILTAFCTDIVARALLAG